MKFWTCLRWIATVGFLALLFVAWMDANPDDSRRCDPVCIGRPAPIF